MRWTDYYLFALLDPRVLYQRIKGNEPRPFALSFTVPALVAITEIVTMSLLGTESSFFYFKVSYGWILYFLYASVKIVITCTLMDMLAQFLGYRGNIREIISLVNFSLLPQIFLLPMVYIFVIVNFAPLFFYIAITLALIVWSAVIVVMGISEMHSMDTGRAVLILIFPYIFVGLALFFFVLLGIIGIMTLLSGLTIM